MKSKRHACIINLINNNIIETQDDLAQKLLESGFKVTQATVSRDIKDLGLIKVMDKSGKYKYAHSAENVNSDMERLLSVFRHAFLSADFANNLAVVRTLPGMAHAAAATIDAMAWSSVLGCIAGDDTIMIVCTDNDKCKNLVEKFNRMSFDIE